MEITTWMELAIACKKIGRTNWVKYHHLLQQQAKFLEQTIWVLTAIQWLVQGYQHLCLMLIWIVTIPVVKLTYQIKKMFIQLEINLKKIVRLFLLLHYPQLMEVTSFSSLIFLIIWISIIVMHTIFQAFLMSDTLVQLAWFHTQVW